MKIFKTDDSDDIGEWNIEHFPDKEKINAIFYKYIIKECCGNGEMLVLMNNGYWYRVNIGHCSCFGPLEKWSEYVNDGIEPHTLRQLKKNISCELDEDLKEIYEIAMDYEMLLKKDKKSQ